MQMTRPLIAILVATASFLLFSICCSKQNFTNHNNEESFINFAISEQDFELKAADFTNEELEIIKSFESFESFNNRDKKFLNVERSLQSSRLTYSEKILKAGFEFEEHKVQTEDGYILSVWRIPRKIGEDRTNKRKPLVLQHGLLDDSWTFLALNESNCLAFLLAEENFDIWLPNSRGNMFSNEHINPDYDPLAFSSNFWNFSFADMAKYDLPAVTEYIKKQTGYQKINWVGHSQGTFQFFLAYTANPEYMENSFEKFGAVGTVATVFNCNSPVVKLLIYTKAIDIIDRFLTRNVLNVGTSLSRVTHFFCTKLTFVCKFIINMIIEAKITNRVDWKTIGDLFFYEPGGSSTKNILHWLQIYKRKILAEYDYGVEKNKEIYGSENPPEYNLNNWKTWSIPSFLTVSDSDPFSDKEDTLFFLSFVENKQNFHLQNLTNYNHLDYLWSNDAKDDVYNDLIAFLKK